MAKTSHPALFLDRDGVVNADKGYVHTAEETEFISGIFELVRQANDAGYKVIIITNQAGIGRGYYTEETFHAYMEWMKEEFRKQSARIDAVYFCPHHPEHGVGEYKQNCECRKPKPGMILQAAKEHGIDIEKSIMLGDKETDMQAAKAAGVGKTVLIGYPDMLLKVGL